MDCYFVERLFFPKNPPYSQLNCAFWHRYWDRLFHVSFVIYRRSECEISFGAYYGISGLYFYDTSGHHTTGDWPVTLIKVGGYRWDDTWLLMTYGLYVMIGLCWLPVVWIQLQLRNMLAEAISNNTPLPSRYHTYFKVWFALAWPAFIGLIGIFYLMVMKSV